MVAKSAVRNKVGVPWALSEIREVHLHCGVEVDGMSYGRNDWQGMTEPPRLRNHIERTAIAS